LFSVFFPVYLICRYLSRKDLSRVFSYLYDDAAIGLVCRYWLTTIIRDISSSPPVGPCIYSPTCFVKRALKPTSVHDVDADMPTNGVADNLDSAALTTTSGDDLEGAAIGAVDDNEEIGDCDSDLGYYTPDVTTRFRKQGMSIHDIRQVVSGTAYSAQDNFIKSSSTDSHDSEKEPALDTLRWRQRRAVLRRTELRREAGTIEEALKELQAQIHEHSSEKRRLREAIIAWKNDFAEKNGRRPSDEEKEEGAKPMYLDHNQCEYVLSKLEPQYLKLYETYQAKLQEIRRFTIGSEE